MSTRVLVTLFFLCCALSPIFSVPIGPGFSELGAIGRLSADQISGCGAYQTGAAGCWLDREQSTSTILCQVSHNVDNAVSIHVGNGTTDYNYFTFPQTGSSYFTEGEFLLDQDDDDEQERDFLAGNWYITITSTNCPNGAISGRLSNTQNVYSYLKRNDVSARGVAVSNYDITSMVFDTYIQHHDVPSVESARLQLKEDDQLLFKFSQYNSPVNQELFFISYRENELYRRQQRYLIESEEKANSIHGTVKVVDAFPNVNYVFSISGSQVRGGSLSEASGSGLLSLECNGDIEFIIIHTMTNIQSGSIRFGPPRADGYTLAPLDILRSPIIKKHHLNDNMMQQLILGNLYVELIDESGESIRGQILPQFEFYSYLSGSQEIPSLSSFDRGVMLLQFSPGQAALEFTLSHTLQSDDVDAQFFKGYFGRTGPQVHSIDAEFTDGVLQESIVVSQVDVQDIYDHLWYINLSTGANPNGALRGQIIRRSESQCFNNDDSDHQAVWFEDDEFTSSFFDSSDNSGAASLSGNCHLLTYLICFGCLVLYSLI